VSVARYSATILSAGWCQRRDRRARIYLL